MSKYIIEIEDEPFVRRSALYGEKSMYRAKGFKSLVFDQLGLDKLTPLDKALDEAYQKGFEAGQHEATTLEYQQGLNDAWGNIIKIALIPYAERSEIFDGQQDILSIVQKFSPSEVTAKLREYEQQKADDEIKVGDEVTAAWGNAVVVRKYTDKDGVERCEYWYYENARISCDVTSNLRKTGRHFPQVAELVKAMKGEQGKVCATCKYIHNMLMCNSCYDFKKWEPKEGAE